MVRFSEKYFKTEEEAQAAAVPSTTIYSETYINYGPRLVETNMGLLWVVQFKTYTG